MELAQSASQWLRDKSRLTGFTPRRGLAAFAGCGQLFSSVIPSRGIDAPVQIPSRSGLTTTTTGGKVPRDLVRPLPLTFTITVFAVFCGAPGRDSCKSFTLSASVNDAFTVLF